RGRRERIRRRLGAEARRGGRPEVRLHLHQASRRSATDVARPASPTSALVPLRLWCRLPLRSERPRSRCGRPQCEGPSPRTSCWHRIKCFTVNEGETTTMGSESFHSGHHKSFQSCL
ncbi:unnamed protein product, partial [Gulo gulo]